MKLFEIQELSDDSMIRNTLGRTMSAEGMIIVLKRIFGHDFTLQDVTPYLRSFNQALKSINPEDENVVQSTKHLWERLAAELSHPKKRSLPLDV